MEKRKQLLQLLCESMKVIPEDQQTILQALNRKDWQDIEDARQMQRAKEAEVEYIVTQNLKDFSTSEINAISEEELCEIIKTK